MKKYIEIMMRNFDKIFKKKNNFGIKFVGEDKEPYRIHIGRAVEIMAGGPSFCGIYRGLRDNDEEFVLFPFAMPQMIPESVISRGEHERVARIFGWSDRPAFILRERVCVLPLDEEYIFERVEQARELNPRIILPDEVSAQDWRNMIKKFWKGGKK